MIVFTTTLQKFGQQGEKTGWTYIAISVAQAKKLKDEKKSFRVKGKIDDHVIKGVAVLPMGGGDFILPVNGEMRKGIRKQKGAVVQVQLEVDTTEIIPPEELIECLKDEPIAQNPNARANENIPEDASHNQDENADIEDEVGTEITDGEDA